MHAILRTMFAGSAMAFATLAAAQVTFYEEDGFRGRTFTTQTQIDNFRGPGFNDRVSSVDVVGGEWEACEGAGFSGRCTVLRPGRYPTLASMGLASSISSVRAANADPRSAGSRYAPARPAAQITFYESEDYRGRTFTTRAQVDDLRRSSFQRLGSSVDVRGERWEVCEGRGFRGRCVLLSPGRYPSLAAMTLDSRVASVRVADRDASNNDDRRAPVAAGSEDYRRRDGERLYQANVTSVHAVVGTPEQRCWIEHGQAAAPAQSNVNVPGALAGALIGGILGHQVGHGTGNDVATIGGAVGGGYLGSKLGTGAQAQPQDIQRCENVSSQAPPSYWDVTYSFEGLDHRVQMTQQPGSTITVNGQGEPRT